MILRILIGLSRICFKPCLHGEAAAGARLPRTNILVCHNRQGEAVKVRSKSDWQKRRAEIVKGMEEVMGPLPGKEKRCALDLKIEEEVEAGAYVRRLVTYGAEPGSRVPAYLLIPKTAFG